VGPTVKAKAYTEALLKDKSSSDGSLRQPIVGPHPDR